MSISQEHTFRGKSFRGRGANEQYRDMSGGMHPNARYHNMSRGKGPYERNHDMSRGMRPNWQNRGMSRGRRPNWQNRGMSRGWHPNAHSVKGHDQGAEESWIKWTEEDYSIQLRREIEDDVNFHKIKHLFEEVKNDFQIQSKLFGGMNYEDAADRVSKACDYQKYQSTGHTSDMMDPYVTSAYSFIGGLMEKNLPALTLKESMTTAKVNLIGNVPSYVLNRIANPAFPRTMFSRSLILEQEIKSLTGGYPRQFGRDLEEMLSRVGRFTVNVRNVEMFRDLHVKAAEFLIEHPEECPYYESWKL